MTLEPHVPLVDHIPHYYGDAVRQLFVVAAVLMLVGAPFYADSLRVELPFEIVGAVILVALAALANPYKKFVFFVGAIAAGVGLVIYEIWALYTYFESTWLQFILREAIAIIFLVAFYFNMKTVRAFVLHRIGKHDEAGEFDEDSGSGSQRRMPPNTTRTLREEFFPWFMQKGGTTKKEEPTESGSEPGPRMSPGRSREEVMPKTHPYEEIM